MSGVDSLTWWIYTGFNYPEFEGIKKSSTYKVLKM